MRNAYKVLVGKPEGKKPQEDLSIDGRIILIFISYVPWLMRGLTCCVSY
jgi:hypothetical protein